MSRDAAGACASIGISGHSFGIRRCIARSRVPAAFVFAAVSAAAAWLLVALIVPSQGKRTALAKDWHGLYDFRPVLRNRSAMAYAIAYCVHTLEMSALRGWGVAFLAYVAASTGTSTSAALSRPSSRLDLALGYGRKPRWQSETATSLRGDGSHRDGMLAVDRDRRLCGFLGSASYGSATVLIALYSVVICLEFVIAHAGTAGTAERPVERRHSLCIPTARNGGGFVGPLLVGWMLDLSGEYAPSRWGSRSSQ